MMGCVGGVMPSNSPQPTNTKIDRYPQVMDQCEALDRALSDLSCLADALENKLAQVTRGYDVATCTPEPPEEVLVPLAESVRSFKKRVASVNERLSSLLNRIEL